MSCTSFTKTWGDLRDLSIWRNGGQLHCQVPSSSWHHLGCRWGQPDARATRYINWEPGRRHHGSDEHAALPLQAAPRRVGQVHRPPQGSDETFVGASQHEEWEDCKPSRWSALHFWFDFACVWQWVPPWSSSCRCAAWVRSSSFVCVRISARGSSAQRVSPETLQLWTSWKSAKNRGQEPPRNHSPHLAL